MEKPTIDMWRALIAFRRRHGRTWKRTLSLAWLSGGDGQEQFAASLRLVRNQLGLGWLYRLKPAVLDAQERYIARLDRLPVMCAALHPDTGDPIVLKRGEMGYWALPDGISVEQFNAASPPTAEQIAAMLAGSVFGWDVPAADPANHGAEGLAQSLGSCAPGKEGGEGAG